MSNTPTPSTEQTRPAARPHQYECHGWSGGISVLVDESTTPGRSNDLEVSVWLVCSVGGNGWSLIERTVGPVRVVMIDVVDDKPVELAAVSDDGAVKELASQGADPAFGERFRHGSAHWCFEDLAAFGSEDLVECSSELAAAVAHECTRPSEPVGVVEEQVPGGLGGPDAAGVVCDPVGAHNSVVGADQGFRAPSWDQESVRDSGHEDSASARIAAGQLPRQSFRHPQAPTLHEGLLRPPQIRGQNRP